MKKIRQNICTLCIHDCNVEDEYFNNCPNFEEGLTCEQYWLLLKENNVNVKRMCDTYGLKRNYLYKMLNGKTRMKYKYSTVINDCVERRNYIPEKSMSEAESLGESDF